MQSALIMTQLVPAREKERLIALRRLKVIDSDPEAQFDAVCRFACSYFQVPIAYIAFIDEGRQWLKAACGIDLTSVPRSGTICSRTILLDRVFDRERRSERCALCKQSLCGEHPPHPVLCRRPS